MIEYILGVVLAILGLAFFIAIAVVKAKIGWSFVSLRAEDLDTD